VIRFPGRKYSRFFITLKIFQLSMESTFENCRWRDFWMGVIRMRANLMPFAFKPAFT